MLTNSLEQYKDLVQNYNLLLEKNDNLKRENRCLQINNKSIGKITEEQKRRFYIEIQERLKCEKTNSEKLQLLKCLLCEKENVMIYWSHIFHGVFENMDNLQDIIRNLINNMSEKLKSIKNERLCSHDDKRTQDSRFEKSGNRLYPCEKDLMSDIKSLCCEHNGNGGRQKIVYILQKCFDSKNPCVPIRTLLEQSNIAICCLIKEIGIENTELKGCQDRDTEISTMKRDLICLTANIKKIQNQNKDLESGSCKMNEELLTKSMMNEKLLMESKKLKVELINMKYCLDMKIEENKSVSKQLSEKNKLIEDQVKTIQKTERKLQEEAETFKKLDNDLKIEKNDNCILANAIVNLREQHINLENVIKDFETQRSLYEEQINNLEKEKSTIEANGIVNLREQQINLENVIKDFDTQRSLYEEQINNLEKEKSAIEANGIVNLREQQINLENVIKDFDTQRSLYEEQINNLEKEKSTIEDMRIDEKKTFSREICEKIQLIENQEKTIQEMNNKLSDAEKKLKESEMLRIICTDKISELTDISSDKTLFLKTEECQTELTGLQMLKDRSELDRLLNECTSCMCSQPCECWIDTMDCDVIAHSKDINCSMSVECQTELTGLKMLEDRSELDRLLNKCSSCMCSQPCECWIDTMDCDVIAHSKDINYSMSVECQTELTGLKMLEDRSELDRLLNKCSSCTCYQPYGCPTTDCGITQCSNYVDCLKCMECQTELTGIKLSEEISERDNLLNKIARCHNEDSEFKKKIEELNAKLDTYKVTVMYREQDLKTCQTREIQLKIANEKLIETLKYKEEKISYEQNKVLARNDKLKKYKAKIQKLLSTIELEKDNLLKSEERQKALMEQYYQQNEKIKVLEQNLVDMQTKQNEKKSKRNAGPKRPTLKTYGPKMNLPCCLGSKNPCQRQIEFNKNNLN